MNVNYQNHTEIVLIVLGMNAVVGMQYTKYRKIFTSVLISMSLKFYNCKKMNI